MAIAEVELNTITRSIRGAMGESAGQFRQAAASSSANLTKIVKDLSNTLAAQRRDTAELHNSIEESVHESQQTSSKIDQLASAFQESISIQTQMLGQLSTIGRNIKILNDSTESFNRNVGTLLGAPGAGGLTNILNMGFGNVAGAIAGIAVGTAAGVGAASLMGGGGGELTNYSGSEQQAKASADKYAGRTLSSNEWSELVKATHAEAGQKSQTEAAMVMASIINRSREKGKSIEQVLREPNQFQAVTGTSVNPGPSPAFRQGPSEKRAEQIYGAAANILEKVSKQQKDFTAASSAAYGAGTNVGYRDKMLAAGGSVVGASVFNTAAPTDVTPVSSTQKPEIFQQGPVPSDTASRTDPGLTPHHINGGAHGGEGHGDGKLSGVNQAILDKFNQIQTSAGTPLTVTSGFRDPAHNAAVGGAKNSAHTRGNAVDVTFGGGIPETLKLIEAASKAGIGGIGVYRPGVLHFDTEGKRAWGPSYHADSIPDWAREAIGKHLGGGVGGKTPDAEPTATTPATTSQMQQMQTAAAGGGLAAAIARSRLIKQEKEKTLKEKAKEQGIRKI